MTLSQRLTRAGLTFILLGTAAAALPQQSGAAMADDPCKVKPHILKIVKGTDSGSAGRPAFTQDADSRKYTSFYSIDNGTNFTQEGNIAVSSVTGFDTPVSGDGSDQITLVKSTGSTSGSATLTDTFTDSGVTYTAMSTVTYP